MKYAHSLPGNPNEAEWEQLDVHLQAVGARAAAFAAPFGLAAWAEAAGRLHDIGKASDAFLAYIRGDPKQVDHSTAGAKEALNKYGRQAGQLLAFAIAGHHAGLADGTEFATRLEKQLKPYDEWTRYAGKLPELRMPPFTTGPYKGFCLFFLTRMLFSCLVDADFLATEDFHAQGRDLRTRGCFSGQALSIST